jgi:two-component system sensor histidine kinase BarA
MEQNNDGHLKPETALPSRDEIAALEAAGGDADLARELVQTLVRGLPTELADLRRCFGASDWRLLAEAAHRMRGATGYCGVPALDNCLQVLERAAKAGDRERSELELARVEQEAERLTNGLNAKA